MKPYYEEDGITIYHGDCRDIETDTCDLMLTDPPYGIHKTSFTSGFVSKRDTSASKWDTAPDEDTLRFVISLGRQAIIWGGNYFNLGPCVAPLLWDKQTGENFFADGEYAWTSFEKGTLRIFRHQWCGAFKDSERNEKAWHPTQKPRALMQWSIAQAIKHGEVQTIIDPYMGSGTTLLAAKQSAIKAIGVELDEQYCEIAVKRLAQGTLGF